MAKSTKISNPNQKSSSGFLWGILVLLVIVAAVFGYIIWNGQGAKTSHLADYQSEDFNATVSYKDNVVTLAAEGAQGKAKEVDLYEDFSCSHCAELAKATDEEMKQRIENGEVIVHIHPLNFLDGQNATDGHSTRAVATTTKLAADGDAKTYWNLRKVLLEDQQRLAGKWNIDDFADAAGELGADGSVVKDMKSATTQDGVAIAQANFNKLQDLTGEVSSPRLLVDGKDVEGSIFDWMKTVLG